MAASTQRPPYKLFPKIPSPLQRLFDAVPLVTYPANDLPARSSSRPGAGDLPLLHVFIHEADARRGRPSFNPTCLKYQVRSYCSPLLLPLYRERKLTPSP